MTSRAKEILKEAKEYLDNTVFPEDTPEFLKSINFRLNKFELNDLLDNLERLEQLEKEQDLEIGKLGFIADENKYKDAIRVLKEAFIVLGKSDIVNTYWFKFLEELEKENQILKKALDKACERLDWDCPVSQNLIDDLDCENCKNTEKECWKKYFLKEVLEDE